ncbi:MAG: hypothetical protein ACSW8G_03455 [Bacillota bacterium]
MDSFMQFLEEIGKNPAVMKWSGAVVLALLGLGFMRVRRHSMKSSLAFAAGILGMIIALSLVQHVFF